MKKLFTLITLLVLTSASWAGNGSHKIAVIDLKKMKPLSAIKFGEHRKIAQFGWTDNDHLLLDINKTVGFLDRKGKWEAMFYMDAKGKKKKELFNRGNSNHSYIVDTLPEDPRHAMIVTSNSGNSRYRLVKYDLRTGAEKKFNKPADPYAGTPRLNADEKPVVSLGFNRKTDSTYLVFTLNLRTGELKKVFRHPVVDVESPVYNTRKEVIGFWLNPDYPQIYWVAPEDPTAKIYQGLMQSFPGQRVRIYNHTNDGKKLVFHTSGDKHPGDFYQLDLNSHKIRKLVSARRWLDPKQLAEGV